MPVITQAFVVQLLLHRIVDNFGAAEIFAFFIHRCPLKWGKRLWYKKGSAHRDLALAVALVLWDLIIANRNFIGEFRDGTHIFFGLGRKAKHKVKFYLLPAALKCHTGTV